MTVPLDTSIYPIKKTSNGSDEGDRIGGVQFGDGYDQTIAEGINYEVDTWDLEFYPRLLSDALTLQGILRASKVGMANMLSWTPPGESTVKYWRASSIKWMPSKGNRWSVSCRLTQKFPLI